MDTPLIYATILALSTVFAVTLTVVVLRFLSVVQQMGRSASAEKSELLREIDASHVQAFTNAMTALGDVQTRVINSQTVMFEKTMDMVHGPSGSDNAAAGELAVDNPNLDMRSAWQATDIEDDMQYADPTDEDMWLGITADVQADQGPRTVSVRPGETLVPK